MTERTPLERLGNAVGVQKVSVSAEGSHTEVPGGMDYQRPSRWVVYAIAQIHGAIIEVKGDGRSLSSAVEQCETMLNEAWGDSSTAPSV